MNRSLLIFGGTGLLGSRVCKYAVSQGVNVISLSPSGSPPSHKEPWMQKVQYLKGDAMDHSTYEHIIPKVNGVIHTIGILMESTNPFSQSKYSGSYEYFNRDTALRICELLENKEKTFVYISAERGPPFWPRYLSTKREVEDYLASNRDKIPNAVLRPGIMYSDDLPK